MGNGNPTGGRRVSHACLMRKSVDTELEEDHPQNFWRKAIDWGRLLYAEAGQRYQGPSNSGYEGVMYSPHDVALSSSWVHYVIHCVAKEEYFVRDISHGYGGSSVEHLLVK